ncbi:MAG: DUF3347 domain-containing protein [Bacteroidales bacterium]|nr:DUF3347 domain-containing protein [Bacteroidales bacterium]
MEMDTEDDESSGENKTALEPEAVPEAFRKQLTQMYNDYLVMKDAYVASDAGKVAKQASKVHSSLDKVKMILLKGEARNKWMDISKTLL